MTKEHTVACYYFPNYHADPRNATTHGPGWTEWELVKRAEPRFAGHRQPRAPVWGYEDEADPAVMARKIDAAADHAIDAFIFDWYWYDDGPFLERALDEGFLGATNNARIKFALMWANHDWTDIHPAALNGVGSRARLLYPGRVSPATVDTVADYVIQRYFSHPSYWKIDDRPYFSIYDLPTFIDGLGGRVQARAALADFRAKVKDAGFVDLHLNVVLWNLGILAGEQSLPDADALAHDLGFDSVTSYVWIHHGALDRFPVTDYTVVRDRYMVYWDEAERTFTLPYYPNLTMGWDASPRTVQSDVFVNARYPFMPLIEGNTPARFREALVMIRERLDAAPAGQRILTINAWNEWTEGSYLEPDTDTHMAYLEAIKDIFG
ncbi:MAG: glycoside hydrolase family 99-like domain-containing protein [Caldilineaceae bacterium]|nr:glycoside hydrolase family 99-like domain-containing protein [Caldilineaceae bacterium]